MRRRGKRLDVDEPLIGEQRFENRVAAVAARDRELVGFDALDQAQGVQIGENLLARGKAIQAAVGRAARSSLSAASRFMMLIMGRLCRFPNS